jgi:hypothetical protein
MGRLITAFVAMSVLVPGADQTREDRADAIVSQLYADYAWEVVLRDNDARTALLDEPRSVLSKYFDDSLVQLIVRDAECRKRTMGACRLNGSPIWDSNDPSAHDLSVVSTNDSSIVRVEFRRRGFRGADEVVRLSYTMVKGRAGWRVKDIVRADGTSLVRVLSAPP